MQRPNVRQRRRGFRKDQAPAYWAILAWIVGLIVFFPVLDMVLTGFKTEPNAISLPPKLIFSPTLTEYRQIISRGFGPFFKNSAVAAIGSTIIVMLLAIPTAYGLALRPTKKWRDVLFFFISTKFMPPAGIIVPLYIIYKDAHLLNTLKGLIIIYTAMNLPIAIWMLRSFFEEIPRDVLDAARVDGAGILREMTQIVVPMVAPGIAATIFIALIFAWNEFFFAVNLVVNENAATVPLFMVKFVTSEGLFWAKLSAAATMAAAPVVIVGWISQRALVRGLAMGAVK